MKVTGERFIPGRMCRDGEIEHYHRYTAVQAMASDKVILDAACGTGYGSKILSKYAHRVYGIDLSEEAIEYANKNYYGDNIQYFQSSVESLPFDDEMFDVVVSFETIEHIDGKIQQAFLKEINRVLKSDGILIMSSPNKKIFTDERGLITLFHVKEFYEKEFLSFISSEFPYYNIYNQYFSKTSNLVSENGRLITPLNYDYDKKGLFFVAVASKEPISEQMQLDSVYYYPEEYSQRNDYLQIYYSETKTFSEIDSAVFDICNKPGVINETMELENLKARFFRIDPNNTSCCLEIENFIFILESGEYREVSTFVTNAVVQEDKVYTFYSKDPQIIVDLGDVCEVRAVTVQFKIIDSDLDIYNNFIDMQTQAINAELEKQKKLESECENLIANINAIESQNEDIKRERDDAQEKNLILQELNLTIKRQNEEIKKDRDDIREENVVLQELNLTIKRQNEEIKKDRDDIKEENVVLQELNLTVKRQNEEILKEHEKTIANLNAKLENIQQSRWYRLMNWKREV